MEFHTPDSLRTVHGLDVRQPTGSFLGAWLARIVASFREAQQRRQDYAALMAMGEHELRDIGLTRADVIAAFEYGPRHRRRAGGG